MRKTVFFIVLISHGAAVPIRCSVVSKNVLHYLSFKYCLIVINPAALTKDELKRVNERHPPVVGMQLPGAQEQVLLSVEPYTTNNTCSSSWELLSQSNRSIGLFDKTRAFVLPLLLFSFGCGITRRRVFGPYQSYQVDLKSYIIDKGSFANRLMRAFLVRETRRAPYSQIPVKFERYLFRPLMVPQTSNQKGYRLFNVDQPSEFSPLTFLFRGVSYTLNSAFDYRHFTVAPPTGSNWVVQYERDSTNRFVPVFANTEYSHTPEMGKITKLPPKLTRGSYADTLLPVAQNLNKSVYVDPALFGIWTNCPESFVVEIDFFLKKCVDLFFSKNWLNHAAFVTSKKFRNSFVEVLLPYNFSFLSELGVLQEKHVVFFIKRVDYKLPLLDLKKKNAPSDISFVVGVTALLGEYVQTVLLYNLTVEQQSSIAVCNKRTRVLNVIACQIYWCLRLTIETYVERP